jgi:hypothetical protein
MIASRPFVGCYTDIFRAIQVSVNALDVTSRERYIALAVLPEDMPAAVPVQQCLWGVNEGEALESAELFLTLSQRGQIEGSIHLHDLQLDYVAAWDRGPFGCDICAFWFRDRGRDKLG